MPCGGALRRGRGTSHHTTRQRRQACAPGEREGSCTTLMQQPNQPNLPTYICVITTCERTVRMAARRCDGLTRPGFQKKGDTDVIKIYALCVNSSKRREGGEGAAQNAKGDHGTALWCDVMHSLTGVANRQQRNPNLNSAKRSHSVITMK